jgi:hypothetical protein
MFLPQNIVAMNSFALLVPNMPLPFLTYTFMVEHIINHLLIDLSMMWHFHQVNQVGCKVVADIME